MESKRKVELFSDFVGEFSKGKTKFLLIEGEQGLVKRQDKPNESKSPNPLEDEDGVVCKIFDGYYFFYQEKNSEENQASWKEAKMDLSPLNFYYVDGLKDICSAHFMGNSKIIVSGWKNNKLFTGILLRKPKDDTSGWENVIQETIDTEHVFAQVATYDNLFIGVSYTTDEILIKALDKPEFPIIYKAKLKPQRIFFKEYASFSRVFSIRESYFFYLSCDGEIGIIDLDKVRELAADPKADIPAPIEWVAKLNACPKAVHFSIYQNSIAVLSSQREIFRHKITEAGIDPEPILKTEFKKSKNFEYHTVAQFNPGFVVTIGTKEQSTLIHNKIVLFDSKLEQTSSLYLERVYLNTYSNPIQCCKAVPKLNLTFLVLSSAMTYVSILGIFEKKLQTMAINIRVGPSRMNGMCLYTQYKNRILLFGFDEFADYSVEKLIPKVAPT